MEFFKYVVVGSLKIEFMLQGDFFIAAFFRIKLTSNALVYLIIQFVDILFLFWEISCYNIYLLV